MDNKDVQSTTSKSVRRFALFVLLILVATMAAMVWKWAERRGYIADMEHSFTQYLADADVFSSRSRGLLAEIEAGKAETEQRLEQLAASLLASEDQLPMVEKLDEEGIGNKSDVWILGAVERLIISSDRYLQLTGDVRSTLASLEYALELLRSGSVSGSSELDSILDKNIEQLRTLVAVDIPGIYQDIEALSAQMDDLPLAMDARLIEIDWAAKQWDFPESTVWYRYLSEVWQDFSQLIKVEKLSDPDMPLLSHSQAHLLRENIKLQLTLAKLALLIRDGDSFRSALETVVNWVSRYYDTQNQSVENMQGELSRLADIRIGSRLPDLKEALEAVRHDQLMLKGEDE